MTYDRKETDQTWKWILVFGNIICFFVFPGHLRSFGVFVVPIQSAFDVNVATVGSMLTVRSVSIMIASLTGPALSDRFTERKVVIVVSVIHLFSYLMVFFANHIISFYVWATIFGFCYGYTIVPTQIIIGKYFQKRRPLAMTICTSGGTLAQLILPPLCAVLMEEYSLFGTFLIVGGIFFNCAAAGALQRPLNMHSKHRQSGNTENDARELCRTSVESPILPKTSILHKSTNSIIQNESELSTTEYVHHVNGKQNCVSTGKGYDSMTPALEEKQAELSNGEYTLPSRTDDEPRLTLSRIENGDQISESLVSDNNVTISDYATRTHLIDSETDHQMKACSIISTSPSEQPKQGFLQRQFDMNLLKSPRFVAVLFINAICFGMILGSKTFAVAIAKDKSLIGELSLLLTVNACTDIPGRIIVVMIVNTKILRTQHIVMLCNLLSAIFTCIYPLTDQYWSMMTVSGMMGVSSAACMYMALPVVIELVGEVRMSKGLGWYSFALFLTPTIIIPSLGSIRDITGSYNVVFYVAGGCIIALVFAYFTVTFIVEHTARTPTRTTKSAEEKAYDETENIHLATGDNVVQETI